jgi:uncharacterized protein YhaN
VKINSIELPGFGCLRDFRADLGAGLNLFYGDNEAGKSTLQQAICAMLYGFHDGERATAAENARHKRYRPWASGLYRGAMTYELEDGRSFEVRRDFSTADVATQLLDGMMGTDVSAQFGRGRHGQVPFARKQLGMSRSVFESCAFISQGEVFGIANNKNAPTEIGDAIAALADSARRDVSAARAIDKLEAATRRIGRDSARTAELPVARDNLRRKREELAAADAARAAVAGKARRLDELQAKCRALKDQVVRLEYACHQAEASRLRDEMRKLEEAESALALATARRDALRDYATVPTAMRDEIAGLRARLQATTEALRFLRASRESVDLVDETRLEYEGLRERVGSFSEEQVRALQAVAYRPAAEVRTGALTHDGGMWAAFVRLARGIGRALTWPIRALLRLSRSAAHSEPVEGHGLEPAEPAETLPNITREEAIALLDKHRRYLTLRPLIEEAARIDAEIQAETASAGALEAQIRALLRNAGIERESLEDGLAAFAAACTKREQYERAAATVEATENRCVMLLAGRTRDEMTTVLAEAEAACDSLGELQPARRPDGRPYDRHDGDPRRVLQKAREDLHRAELEAEGLDSEVRVALEGSRPRAEIEEAVAYWEREVVRLECGRAALMLARTTIEEAMAAVYRDFAPAVNTFLSEGIEAATDGRYTRAHVDPATLRISLLVPETGEVLSDPPVSHGTRTLLYVLMRIGLAQHMSAIGEPVPLILDDPFVDVDARRLRRMLDFLLVLSRRMQVFLFTKDREIVAWFEENAADGPHRVHIMPGALSASLL